MAVSTLSEHPARATGQRGAAQLYLALECGRPLARSARHSLGEVAEVVLSRGAGRSVTRSGGVLTLSIPDRWMSAAHARLIKVMGHWVVEDTASKNGLRVNGEVVTRSILEDHDTLEVGHSFLVFREAEAQSELDLEAEALPAVGLRTLLPDFTQRLQDLAAVATSNLPVLLQGETGTGKELIAREVHAQSNRSGAFMAVNCGGLTSTLIEGELFGHLKGSFSGANEDRPGLVRASDKGTLFLDEIADLPLAAQPVLLRVLQEKEVTPVGGTRPVKVDLRVVSASHGALAKLAKEEKFRADLLARLSGFTLPLPPLRERLGELGLLVGDLLEKLAPERAGRISFSLEAGRRLMHHDWPLNVRELEHGLEAALAIARGGEIDLVHLPESIREAKDQEPGKRAEPAVNREQLLGLLAKHEGNVSAVARALGEHRTQVQRWLKRYVIPSSR